MEAQQKHAKGLSPSTTTNTDDPDICARRAPLSSKVNQRPAVNSTCDLPPDVESLEEVEQSIINNYKMKVYREEHCFTRPACDFTDIFGEELVLFIFSFLSPKDLCSIAATCKTWHRIAMDESLWRRMCGPRKKGHLMPFFVEALNREPSWKEFFRFACCPHKWSDTHKSSEVELSKDKMTATALKSGQNYSVQCSTPITPSKERPFHYFEIFVKKKLGTHISIGLTDEEWKYTGNLVGLSRRSFNYCYHSDGLVSVQTNTNYCVPRYTTGDYVSLLVEYHEPNSLSIRLFKDEACIYTWKDVVPTHPLVYFTAALNGKGVGVTLNKSRPAASTSSKANNNQNNQNNNVNSNDSKQRHARTTTTATTRINH